MVGTATTKIFSERLRELIKESGKDVKSMAKSMGIASGSLSKYQNGEAEAGCNAVKKIADYFSVSADYLLGLSDCREGENSDICRRSGLNEQAVQKLVMMNSLKIDDSPYIMGFNSGRALSNLINHDAAYLLIREITHLKSIRDRIINIHVDGTEPLSEEQANEIKKKMQLEYNGRIGAITLEEEKDACLFAAQRYFMSILNDIAK